ncbi:MAG: DUF4956 domain-containing protein [Myxococcales bacterium]|nr:DUF4956 domain-containing protein [Myxococcales bacterium]
MSTDAIVEILAGLIPRITLDAIATFLLLLAVYGRGTRDSDASFTLWVLNLVVFSVVGTLSLVRIDVGLGLGLFGVFGVLRYRTESMQGRDLTVLFAVIGIAMLSAVATTLELMLQVAFVLTLLLVAVFVLGARRRAGVETVSLVYDRTDLLGPRVRAALLADLSKRLGAEVSSVTVRRLDLVRDAAELQVVFAAAAPAPTEAPVAPAMTRTAIP